MTGNDVLIRAWAMVNDNGDSKRTPIAQMALLLNDGIRDVLSRRPYLNLLADGSLTGAFADLTASTVIGAVLPLEDSSREALAHYVAARVYEMDASDEHNARQAQYHRATYHSLT